ncbi:MAG TPA: LamG domain-containing protein [Methylomirabilota bacterium]|nr:LamG domain-containing protein [Methylomirabilota bacterium]
MTRRWLAPFACAALLALGGCAHHEAKSTNGFAPEPPRLPPEQTTADSATVGLWHFDERSGPRVQDSGPFRMNGVAGPDARVEFGRFKSARSFTATVQSFVVVPYNPVMESPRAFTVEAWIFINAISSYELSPIAMRWSPIPTEQSWVLGIVGRDLVATQTPSPGWFSEVVGPFITGRLVFAFRPETANSLQRFSSSTTLPTDRWVHVAASVDGEVVRIFIDGRLDVQVAVANGIKRSEAPLVIGNALDPRRLTDLSGELKQDLANAPLPWYALNGLVDELRLSNTARKEFESTDAR